MKLNQGMLMAAGCAMAIGAAASAQPGGQPPRPGPAMRVGMPTQIIGEDSTQVSVNFPGGTLEEYVKALREGTKDPVNISLQGQAAKLRIEPMMLREVSVESALRAALGSRPGQPMLESDGSMTSTRLEAIESAQSGKSVFVVTTQRAAGGGPGASDASIDVLSIRSLVQSPDENEQKKQEQMVLNAIDSGLGMMGTAEGVKPQIDYHKDSGLLLVRGQARDVALVSEIVKRMTDDRKRLTAEARERVRFENNSSAAIQRAELSMHMAENRASEAQKRLDETKKLAEAGTASVRELSDARLAVAQAEGEAGLARVEFIRVRNEAKTGLDAPVAAEGGNEEVAQLRAELGKALARIRELEDQVAAKRAPDRSAPKGK